MEQHTLGNGAKPNLVPGLAESTVARPQDALTQRVSPAPMDENDAAAEGSVDSNILLTSILKVLQRIETRLDENSQSMRLLEAGVAASCTSGRCDVAVSSGYINVPSDQVISQIAVSNQDLVQHIESIHNAGADEECHPAFPDVQRDQSRVYYVDYPLPTHWETSSIGKNQPRQAHDPDGPEQNNTRQFWKLHLGSLWLAPPDGRIELGFQKHLLERLKLGRSEAYIKELAATLKASSAYIDRRPILAIDDYGILPGPEFIKYRLLDDVPAEELYTEILLKRRSESQGQLGDTIAPWRRVIRVKGFSRVPGNNMIVHNNDETKMHSSIFRFQPGSTYRSAASNIASHLFLGQACIRVLEDHRHCRNSSHPIGRNFGLTTLSFHITFFELLDPPQVDSSFDTWKAGKLFGDGFDEMWIRKSACTVLIVKETNTSQCRPSEYWTALLLRPETFNRYRRRSFKVTEPSVAGKNMPADIVNDILDLVFLKWQEIAARLDLLNDDKHLLLDREAHDRLLFDDDSFSRSRKYFWMINFLAECNSLISETIEEAKLYMQEWPRELDLGVDWDGGDCLHKEALSLVDQLSLVKYNLNEMRAGVIAIRDGLFSASSVIESRASTRLGENIKLLTFVSIFFLPLSFCMSIWSVSDQLFSLKALITVAITVALGTYLTVFNLNVIVGVGSELYSRKKRRILDQMVIDPDERWKDQGRLFQNFEPKREARKPSEWKLLQFVLHRLYQAIRHPQWTRPKAILDANAEHPGPCSANPAGRKSWRVLQADDIQQSMAQKTILRLRKLFKSGDKTEPNMTQA